MSSKPSYNYTILSTSFQVLQIFLFVTLLVPGCYFVKDFLIKKRSFFNIFLAFMILFSLIGCLTNALTPNEAIASRLGLDVLPINVNSLIINAFLTASTYFEGTSIYYCISYMRAWSLVQLKPKWEQNLLKSVVVGVIVIEQISIVLYIIKLVNQLPGDTANVLSVTGATVYLFVELYFLIKFINFVRNGSRVSKGGKADERLMVISKFGIAQFGVFTSLIVINNVVPTDGGVRDFAMAVACLVSNWVYSLLFISMSYMLRAVSHSNAQSNNSTKVPGLSKLKVVSTKEEVAGEKSDHNVSN